MLRIYVVLAILCCGISAAIVGCGGSGNSSSQGLGPSGKKTFNGSVTGGSTTKTLSDPLNTATVTVPVGSVSDGASVRLAVWSSQRKVAQVANFQHNNNAVDITIDPSTLSSTANVTVAMPWNSGGDRISTMIVGFGPTGKSLVLADVDGSTPSAPVVAISPSELKFLLGNATGPQTIEVAVEQESATVPLKPKRATLTKLWSRPKHSVAKRPTHYASRTRIAIVVHGMLDGNQSADGLQTSEGWAATIIQALQSKAAGDNNGPSAAPLDEIWAYNYDYSQTIESNGAQFAAIVNGQTDANGALWGDSTKFEIHIVAHSMGGLVSRWGLERAGGMPSVTQLITLGTPHQGVPLAILKELGWQGSLLSIGVSLIAPGIRELVDDSTTISNLESDSAACSYDFIGGSSHANLYGILGDAVNALYFFIKISAFDANDGIVPEYSSLGGPGGATAIVGYNHTELKDKVQAYWSTVTSGWLGGINRQIDSLELGPTSASVSPGQTIQCTVQADDVDGDKIDPTLVGYSTNLPVTWSVDQPNFATIDSKSGVLTGVAAGTVTVTATFSDGTKTSTGGSVSQTLAIQVGDSIVGTWAWTNNDYGNTGVDVFNADGTFVETPDSGQGGSSGNYTYQDGVLTYDSGYTYSITWINNNEFTGSGTDGNFTWIRETGGGQKRRRSVAKGPSPAHRIR